MSCHGILPSHKVCVGLAGLQEPLQLVANPPLPAHIQATMCYAGSYYDQAGNEVTFLQTGYIAHLPGDLPPMIIKDVKSLLQLAGFENEM